MSSPEAPLSPILRALQSALGRSSERRRSKADRRADAFWAEGQLPIDGLAVTVNQLGPLANPLPPAQSRALLAASTPARHGQRDKIVLDKRVRDTGELRADSLALHWAAGVREAMQAEAALAWVELRSADARALARLSARRGEAWTADLIDAWTQPAHHRRGSSWHVDEWPAAASSGARPPWPQPLRPFLEAGIDAGQPVHEPGTRLRALCDLAAALSLDSSGAGALEPLIRHVLAHPLHYPLKQLRPLAQALPADGSSAVKTCAMRCSPPCARHSKHPSAVPTTTRWKAPNGSAAAPIATPSSGGLDLSRRKP